MEKIKANSHILIIDNSDNRRVYRLRGEPGNSNQILHYKNCIDTNQLIGKHFNSFFMITDARSGDLEELTD